MKIKASVGIFLFSVLLLGAKCATDSKAVVSEAQKINNKDDIIEIIPELKEYSQKFEISKYDDLIKLITYDELTFQEAVHILKTETSMNMPVFILLRTDEDYSIGEGELKSECAAERVVTFTDKELRPYTGIIYIFDGYWTAIEFKAFSLFPTGNGNKDAVSITEYGYANEVVYSINDFSTFSILSRFDEGKYDRKVQGDGSIPYEIITEFDK